MGILEKTVAEKRVLGHPTVLVLAASERAPAYEAQMRVLEEQADEFSANGILIGCVLLEGESHIGSERIDREEASEILDRYFTDEEDFQIIVLSEGGEVVRSDDAPLQGSAILRALDKAP